MSGDKLTELAATYIREAAIEDHFLFPKILVDVDHAKLGELLRQFRLKSGVEAQQVAAVLDRTKPQMHFLETGIKKWDIDLVRRYIAAVMKIGRENAQTPR